MKFSLNKRKPIDLLQGNILISLTRLALPIMASALLQMAYNLVDMIWIGRLGYQPVAAVGVAGFFIWFGDGFLMLSRVGAQVFVGQALGRKDEKEAKYWAAAALQFTAFLALFYCLIQFLFAPQLIGFFRLGDPVTAQQGISYLRIVGLGYLFTDLARVFTALVTVSGQSHISMRASCVGLVLNILLDPLFIFGFRMGVAGAAWATVLSQIIVLLAFLVSVRPLPLFHRLPLRSIHLKAWWSMLKLGLPTALQTMAFSSISMVLGRMVSSFGAEAVSIQKVGSQIESLSWMTAEGFGVAVTAFMAQNYGARLEHRIRKGYLQASTLMGGLGVVTTSLLLLFPGFIFQLFIPDPLVLQGGISYLKILGLSQLFMCMEIMTAAAFSGVGKTLPPALVIGFLTLARIPLAATLMQTSLGLDGIWWAITLSSNAKGLLLLILFLIYLHKNRKPTYPKDCEQMPEA